MRYFRQNSPKKLSNCSPWCFSSHPCPPNVLVFSINSQRGLAHRSKLTKTKARSSFHETGTSFCLQTSVSNVSRPPSGFLAIYRGLFNWRYAKILLISKLVNSLPRGMKSAYLTIEPLFVHLKIHSHGWHRLLPELIVNSLCQPAETHVYW